MGEKSEHTFVFAQRNSGRRRETDTRRWEHLKLEGWWGGRSEVFQWNFSEFQMVGMSPTRWHRLGRNCFLKSQVELWRDAHDSVVILVKCYYINSKCLINSKTCGLHPCDLRDHQKMWEIFKWNSAVSGSLWTQPKSVLLGPLQDLSPPLSMSPWWPGWAPGGSLGPSELELMLLSGAAVSFKEHLESFSPWGNNFKKKSVSLWGFLLLLCGRTL